MENETNINLIETHLFQENSSPFDYKNFSKFKIENKNLANLNKLLKNVNKIYSYLLHTENEKLNKKAFKKYKSDLKKGFENNWVQTQLNEIGDLNDLDKHFSSQNLRENYLKDEPVDFKENSIRRILYFNKALWSEVEKLIKKISQKIYIVKNQLLVDPNNLINDFYQNVELNNSLVENWKSNLMIFKNSFKLTRDIIKNNKKNLSKILNQNEKLLNKFENFVLLNKRLFSVINIDSEIITEKEIIKADEIVFHELNKMGNISFKKSDQEIYEKNIKNIISESENVEKLLYEIKNSEDIAKESFSNLEKKLKNHEMHRINSSMYRIDLAKKEAIEKIELIQKRGELLSDKIDLIMEKLRRYIVSKLISESDSAIKKDLIISFSALRNPSLNEGIKNISKIVHEEKISTFIKFDKKVLKNQIVVFEDFYKRIKKLNTLLKNLLKNKPIYNISELGLDKYSKLKNKDIDRSFNEIIKKDKYKDLKLKNIHLKQVDSINNLLNDCIEIQTKLLQKFYNPELTEEVINIAFDLNFDEQSDKKFLTKNQNFNFKKSKILNKIDLLLKNQKKFSNLKNLNDLEDKIINLGEKNIHKDYLKKYSKKNIDELATKIKVSKIRDKELFKRKITKIEGFNSIKEKNNYLFDLDLKELNKIDYSYILENRKNKDDFSKIFEYFKNNIENIDNWIINSAKTRRELNKRMAYLMTKYTYLAENINEFNYSFESEKLNKLIDEKKIEIDNIVSEHIKKLEKEIETRGIDIDIAGIRGIGPKIKSYLKKWKIITIKDLIEATKIDDISIIIENLPGLKNERYKEKAARFNNFLIQAKVQIRKENDANDNEKNNIE